LPGVQECVSGVGMVWNEIFEAAEKRSVLRFLGPLAPAAVRRAGRMERVTQEISRAAVVITGKLPEDAFDTALGASGRPPAVFGLSGGAPTSRHVGVSLKQVNHWSEILAWSGAELSIAEAKLRGRKFTLPLASRAEAVRRGGRSGAGAVAEVALFAQAWNWTSRPRSGQQHQPERIHQGSLHFLNAQGYAVLFVPEVDCDWQRLVEVVEAAGLPFHVYVLSCPQKTAEKIAGLLFPRRRNCIKIQH
jgi:hypothetical protein